ncbi:putative aquaporin-9 [Necator americanus]|uniref:Putative aquaporin-9 n=1 Tax=Necator americanus TaxID=51031 RepID=W2SL84_NECAM|nr:putative aquaporin-9 [Necator americanus]ETN69636.1 putative aquaporin-9 [Necator americanus]
MAEIVYPEERLRQKIQIKDATLRNSLSEFLGTALLLFIGIGIVMQFILSGEKLNTWIQVNVGWGMAIAFSVYACSKTSGGHLNPAVSLAFVTLGRLSVKDFICYSIAQTFGAFVGTVGAFGIYYDQFIKYAGNQRTIAGPKATALCFCSFPALHVAGTALLMFFVCVIIDKRIAVPGPAHPLLFGLVVLMIGTSMGMNVGYPINPARDLGPRIFMLFLGYGSQAFTYHSFYFWIPVVAPLVGAVLAAWTYHLFIGAHIPDPKPIIVQDEAKQPLRYA